MNAYEIDITARDKNNQVWSRKTYIVKAKDPNEALKKVYKQTAKDFKGLGDVDQVESLKRLDTAVI